MIKTVSSTKAYIVIMHMKGTPKYMQINPVYKDVTEEIYSFLYTQTNSAIESGIEKDRIIIDLSLIHI